MWVAGRGVEISGSGFAPRGEFSAGGAAMEVSRDAPLMRALQVAALCNRAHLAERDHEWVGAGDPTEVALLVLTRKAGIDPLALTRSLPEKGELPFSADRRLMATFHQSGDRTLALIKGAPGTVVARCGWVLTNEGVLALDAAGRTALLERNRALAARGLRVIALADAELDQHDGQLPAQLTFLGFAGLLDPPAPGVPETIAAFRTAGIRTVMLTGDQRLTGESIARGLGVVAPGDQVLEGVELDALGDEALAERMASTAVVSRASPEGKLRVIVALQGRGESVAMLGDGVNDAAALRQADIGVAMGRRGTDVAKEAADVILADDRFQTTEAAIEEGRVIFDNIRKFVYYLFSCNLAEILVLLFAGLAGLPAPLLPLQILWLNLLTDTAPALALALEPAEPNVMRRPPRPAGESLLTRTLVRSTIAFALAIAGVTLAGFWWGANAAGRPEGHGVTMSFMTLAFAQIFHLGNARSSSHVLSRSRVFANRYAFAAVIAAALLQIAALEVPWLAAILHLTAFAPKDWVVVLALAAIPAVAGQALKAAPRTASR
jgi:Ca2+-transporting ATPase